MTIQILLRDIDEKDLWLNLKESKKAVIEFWMFSHEECCGMVDYEQMENFFTEMHQEFDEKATTIDTFEFKYIDFNWDIERAGFK